MGQKKRWKLTALVACGAAVAVVFYVLGYWMGYRSLPDAQTFYATITDVGDGIYTVEGLAVNDINFRGAFTFSLEEDTAVTWRYTDLSPEDLEVGDTVAITFTGEILETYPARLMEVTVVQLLDDEV